jgi:hypothetical protein
MAPDKGTQPNGPGVCPPPVRGAGRQPDGRRRPAAIAWAKQTGSSRNPLSRTRSGRSAGALILPSACPGPPASWKAGSKASTMH